MWEQLHVLQKVPLPRLPAASSQHLKNRATNITQQQAACLWLQNGYMEHSRYRWPIILSWFTSLGIRASKRTAVLHLCNKLLSPASLHTSQSAKFALILLAFSLAAFWHQSACLAVH